MAEYRKVALTYKAVQFDGKNVEELEEFLGATRVKVINKGLVNAAPQVIVHAALNSPALAIGDWVVIDNQEGKISVLPDAAFRATFEETDGSLVAADFEGTVVNVDSIAAGVGVDERNQNPDPASEAARSANVNVTDAEAK